MDRETAVSDLLLARPELQTSPGAAFKTVREALDVRGIPLDDGLLEGDRVRFVCISDTHGRHREIEVPEGDVLLHAGDFTRTGSLEQVQEFLTWFQGQPHPVKIFIAGNHDIALHEGFYAENWTRWHRRQTDDEETRKVVEECEGVVYLRDSSVNVFGYEVYGSPWQPVFHNWAFNLERGTECAEMWAKIPEETDILITHGPPLGLGDRCVGNQRAGCVDLLREVLGRVKPLVHVFGHIHEDSGVFKCCSGHTRFINASTCTLRYRALHPPIVFDLSSQLNSAETVEENKEQAASDGNEQLKGTNTLSSLPG